MDEKLKKVVELLENEIPTVVKFKLPRIGSVNIAVDPVLIEQRGAEMIALGVKIELENFVHFLVFKQEV